MRIVADQAIPQVAEAFRGLGEVELIPGREINNSHLKDCDCLLVRTVTRVDEALLKHSSVRFIASATIGTDHIDKAALKRLDIGFANAAGCNAEAASEYVISGLFALSQKNGFDPFERKAGIVGYGNVGKKLQEKLSALGIDYLLNDPPLQQQGNSDQPLVELEQLIAECDFISLHTPLTREGDHPSYHLFDTDRLTKLRQGCLLVNAARGEVVDNQALLALLKQRDDLSVFLDTWENEPSISRELLGAVDLATPHIAGYSVEGRLRGTQMILDATCDYFAKTSTWRLQQLLPQASRLEVKPADTKLEFWQNLFQAHFNIWRDDAALRLGMNDDEFERHFDSLRRVYPDRLEYPLFELQGVDENTAAVARGLHFKLAY